MTLRSDDSSSPVHSHAPLTPQPDQSRAKTLDGHNDDVLHTVGSHILIRKGEETPPPEVRTISSKKAEQILPGLTSSTSMGNLEEAQHQQLSQSFSELLHTQTSQRDGNPPHKKISILREALTPLNLTESEKRRIEQLEETLNDRAGKLFSGKQIKRPEHHIHHLKKAEREEIRNILSNKTVHEKEILREILNRSLFLPFQKAVDHFITAEIKKTDQEPSPEGTSIATMVSKESQQLQEEALELKKIFPDLSIDSHVYIPAISQGDLFTQIAIHMSKKSLEEISTLRIAIEENTNIPTFQKNLLHLCNDIESSKKTQAIRQKAKRLEQLFSTPAITPPPKKTASPETPPRKTSLIKKTSEPLNVTEREKNKIKFLKRKLCEQNLEEFMKRKLEVPEQDLGILRESERTTIQRVLLNKTLSEKNKLREFLIKDLVEPFKSSVEQFINKEIKKTTPEPHETHSPVVIPIQNSSPVSQPKSLEVKKPVQTKKGFGEILNRCIFSPFKKVVAKFQAVKKFISEQAAKAEPELWAQMTSLSKKIPSDVRAYNIEVQTLKEEAAELKKMFPEISVSRPDVPDIFKNVILIEISTKFSKMSSKALIKMSRDISENQHIPHFKSDIVRYCVEAVIQKQLVEIKEESKRLEPFFPDLTIDASENEQELKSDVLQQIREQLSQKTVLEIEQIQTDISSCENLSPFQEELLRSCHDEITKRNLEPLQEERERLE